MGEDYRAGRLLTGQLKAKCIQLLQTFVKDFQERKAKVTDDDIRKFMDTTRKITPKFGKRKTQE